MKRKLLILTIAFIIISAPILYIWQALAYKGRIYPGTQINGYDVGGLTQEQAVSYLKKTLPNTKYLLVYTNNFHRRLNLAEFKARPDFIYAAKKAYKVGRGSGLTKDLATVLLSRFELTVVNTDYRLDAAKLKNMLKIISVQINQPPVNAQRVVSGNKITLIPGQTGYKLIIDLAAEEIMSTLSENRRKIELPVVKTSPKTTLASLKKQNINSLLGEFQTTLNPHQTSRNNNIKIASNRIDGTVLTPGSIFSFDKIVGRRNQANGFQAATEIRNGNLAKGIGGGICQVATTLYNAFMSAGLPTLERHIHSNYIAAYPTGRDASIAEGRYDLKFENNTNSSVLIKVLVDNERLIIRIYGRKNNRVNTFTKPIVKKMVAYKIKYITDKTLPPGTSLIIQKGIAGRNISLERYVKSNDGKLLFKENIISHYQPRTEIIKTAP